MIEYPELEMDEVENNEWDDFIQWLFNEQFFYGDIEND